MKTAASIIIVVAALIFAFFLGRSSYTPEPPKVIEKWLTKYDTVEYRDTVKIPVPQVIVRDTTIYLPGEIDTAALLADYLARKEYPSTFPTTVSASSGSISPSSATPLQRLYRTSNRSSVFMRLNARLSTSKFPLYKVMPK